MDASQPARIKAQDLGASSFRQAHGVKYAYVTGSMYKGIASKELVLRMAHAGLLGYLGTGGMKWDRLISDLRYLREKVPSGAAFGANILHNFAHPEAEARTIDLLLEHKIRRVEAAAFLQITPALVTYRVSGLARRPDGSIHVPHMLLAKVSRPEIAEQFLSPPPANILSRLVEAKRITADEAELARHIPMSDDICVESDSGGHTDQGVAFALIPAMLILRDRIVTKHNYATSVRLGAAGGLGTPEAIAAAFILGADFVLTGSVNQCTVEAGISDSAKDLLQEANVQDTAIVPAGDMFEIGARAQVLKRGLFFPARANKLYDLYRQFNAWQEIDAETRDRLETKFFHKTVEEVYAETKAHYLRVRPAEIEKAEANPKHKLALILRWYFVHTARLALKGVDEQRVDFQIHCGPALGAFNQWVKGTNLEDWRHRHVDDIAERLMNGAAACLNDRFNRWTEGVGLQQPSC
jgi:trans-AT polyketide synthase/acyltransferase/oxidoreductase domain-containing protein